MGEKFEINFETRNPVVGKKKVRERVWNATWPKEEGGRREGKRRERTRNCRQLDWKPLRVFKTF